MPTAALSYTPRFKEYDLGRSHPMRPSRVLRTYDLIRACGLLEPPSVSLHEPSQADEDTLALIHSPDYIAAVRAPAEGRSFSRPFRFGLGTVDTPITEGLYEAAALIVGASVQAADLVADGQASVAFNPAGGLHHAHRARAAGFCVFNDAAIAIAHLLRRTGDGVRIAYLDIDAHHGDGVQEAFYSRRDVLTISLHESGRYLYPSTGEVEEIGDGEGEGFSVNLPLSPYTNDYSYLWAFREAIIPMLEAFQPDFVVTQLGVDTHYSDPLTHMCLTTQGYLSVVQEIASRFPRWIALGGGGYNVETVPRAWTLAFAAMAGMEPPERIPKSQARRYRSLVPAPCPGQPEGAGEQNEADAPEQLPCLHDTAVPVVDEDWARVAREFAEETVEAVKSRLFPYHGLSAPT